VKIGIASLFAFRPHVEHLAYLSGLLERDGHSVHGFTCDAAVEHCYSRDLRGQSRLKGCPACMVGGIRSYPIGNVWSVRRGLRKPLSNSDLHRITVSSVATAQRTETQEELHSAEFTSAQEALRAPAETIYANGLEWIRQRGLDAVVLFNGRMDLTAALRTACRDAAVPCVTVERAWFGHGLLLIPNADCLSLAELGRMSAAYRDIPLTADQAAFVGRVAADRFRQRNDLEWRLYNQGATAAQWPSSAFRDRRALILPSSRNEFEGHPEFECEWHDATQAIDAALDRLRIDPRDCVMRSHPNWAERIGRNTGWRSEQHWARWAAARGIHVIRAAERANTYNLIDQTDTVFVNGSSTGLEAALRGRKVVCIGPSLYQEAGFAVSLLTSADVEKLDALVNHDPRQVTKRAMRYLYMFARRFTQYVDYVRARTTLDYEYRDGADPGRLVRLLQTGRLEADDPQVSADGTAEDVVASAMASADWSRLGQWQEVPRPLPPIAVRRRVGMRWVDSARKRMTRGDL
jgi:hypothetical protein